MALLRSNYFAVNNEAVFEDFCEQYGMEAISENESARVGFVSDYYDDFIDLTEFVSDGEAIQELTKLLAEGHVAVVMMIDHDKLRFLTGYACAVNSKGETREISLDDIYIQAAPLGSSITPAEY